jgi:hypothetical protein
MKPTLNFSGSNPMEGENPASRRLRLIRYVMRGAVIGLAAGLFALVFTFVIAWRCLPFHISQPPPPWPWVCSDPAFGVLDTLAFPVNLLTNDLARAIPLAPLSLLFYATLGTLAGLVVGLIRNPGNVK